MTRIIAGEAGGVPLVVPRTGTRPTSDRVRESLFGSLEASGMLQDARVLDLYAGSGALGLEAASRGAREVDLVERSRPAAALIGRNSATVSRSLSRKVPLRVHAVTALTFLRRDLAPVDLALLDPPYDIAEDELAAVLTALSPLLGEHGLLVLERAARSGAPDWERADLLPVRDRRYGDTILWWAQRTAPLSPSS